MNYSMVLWAIFVGTQVASIVHLYRWTRQLAEREKLLPLIMHLTVPGPDQTMMVGTLAADLWIASMGRN